MRVWTNYLTVGKNSISNFSRQNLNRNVQSPSVSTVMTHHSAQPKPVWKKAPSGLQRPSRIANPSGWPSITLRYLTHSLDPTLKATGARVFPTIRLLKKDIKESRTFTKWSNWSLVQMCRCVFHSCGDYYWTLLSKGKIISQIWDSFQNGKSFGTLAWKWRKL